MIRNTLAALALALLAAGCEKAAPDLMSEARMAAFEKRPQEALALYRKALDIIERDESPEALVLRARALRGAADVYNYELQDIRQAVAVYRELIAQCPEAPETLEARVILADLLEMRFRDTRGAITELTAALDRNPPQSAELHYRVASLYFQLQDYPQAELEAQKVATKYEASAFVDDAMMLRAQALLMIESRRNDASRAFEDLVHRYPSSELAPHALFELGKMRDEAGEDEKAIEYWVSALENHPQPQVVQSQIARVRTRIENTSPRGIGNRVIALDRHQVAVVRHVSSDAAMGVKAGSNEAEPLVSHEVPAAAQAPAPKPAPPKPAILQSPAPAVAQPAVAQPAAPAPAAVPAAATTAEPKAAPAAGTAPTAPSNPPAPL